MTDYTLLYFGTFAMITMSGAVVFFVVLGSSAFKKQRDLLAQRDKQYLSRIEVVENLVKTEFKQVLEYLKKLPL
jgi:hypothetical protein